jgi:hypothetical protein
MNSLRRQILYECRDVVADARNNELKIRLLNSSNSSVNGVLIVKKQNHYNLFSTWNDVVVDCDSFNLEGNYSYGDVVDTILWIEKECNTQSGSSDNYSGSDYSDNSYDEDDED